MNEDLKLIRKWITDEYLEFPHISKTKRFLYIYQKLLVLA